VLVVHENRGLTDHIRSVASRLAASGYSALAIDLLSEEGGTASFPDEAAAPAALYSVPTTRFVADMKAGVTELRRRLPGKKVAATGFLLRRWNGLDAARREGGEARGGRAVLRAAPEGSSLKGSKAAVLGIYAALDTRVNASRPAADAALRAAGLPHQLVTFPGVDHAFFNDTGGRYNRTAADAAYKRVLAWFKRYVG
jgi:carboxymethylenebutenolidase